MLPDDFSSARPEALAARLHTAQVGRDVPGLHRAGGRDHGTVTSDHAATRADAGEDRVEPASLQPRHETRAAFSRSTSRSDADGRAGARVGAGRTASIVVSRDELFERDDARRDLPERHGQAGVHSVARLCACGHDNGTAECNAGGRQRPEYEAAGHRVDRRLGRHRP